MTEIFSSSFFFLTSCRQKFAAIFNIWGHLSIRFSVLIHWKQWCSIPAMFWFRFWFQTYSESLISILIPGFLWKPDSDFDSNFQQKVPDSTLIPIPAQILWFRFQLELRGSDIIAIEIDSDSDSSQKWNHSGIDSSITDWKWNNLVILWKKTPVAHTRIKKFLYYYY